MPDFSLDLTIALGDEKWDRVSPGPAARLEHPSNPMIQCFSISHDRTKLIVSVLPLHPLHSGIM
jgi:hypothetical protein